MEYGTFHINLLVAKVFNFDLIGVLSKLFHPIVYNFAHLEVCLYFS